MVERVRSYFDRDNENSLVNKIETIAKNGGEDTFTVDVDGIWELHPYDETGPENNSIQFIFRSKVSNLAPDMGWIPLDSPNIGPYGIVGIDEPSVIFGRSESSNGAYTITYKIWFRQLNSSYEDKYYLIRLVPMNPSAPKSSTSRTIKISRPEEPKLDPATNIIITEVQILL